MAKTGTDDQTSKGTSNALPCPWCGEIMTGLDSLEENLKVGTIIDCDFCENLIEFTAVNEIISIKTQRYGAMKNNGHLK